MKDKDILYCFYERETYIRECNQIFDNSFALLYQVCLATYILNEGKDQQATNRSFLLKIKQLGNTKERKEKSSNKLEQLQTL